MAECLEFTEKKELLSIAALHFNIIKSKPLGLLRCALPVLLSAVMLFSTVSLSGCSDWDWDDEEDSAAKQDTERGYFGSQLETSLEQEIYDEYVTRYVVNESDVGTFTMNESEPCTFEVELPDEYDDDELDAIIEQNEDYQQGEYNIERSVVTAFQAFEADYPQIFWLYWYDYNYYSKGEVLDGVYQGSLTDIEITTEAPYKTAYSERDKVAQNIEKAISSIIDSMEDDSRYSQVKAIHDYICDNAEYDNKAAKHSGNAKYHYAHVAAPLFNGKGVFVCEGYAKAFKILCDIMEIPCLLVEGTTDSSEKDSSSDHMWNYVQMEDDEWYGVDVTWDDEDDGIGYDYFLVGKRSKGFDNIRFSKDHIPSTAQVELTNGKTFGFSYPELSENGYE